MTEKYKIVLDVDGVLLNFIKRFEELVKRLEKKGVIKNIEINEKVYNLDERYNLTKEQEKFILEQFTKEKHWKNLEALEGVLDAVKLINKYFDVYIVTAIEDENKQDRIFNLKNIGINPKEIYCVGVHGSKEEALKKIDPDVYIDDRLDHLHHANFVYHLAWLNDHVLQNENNLKDDKGVDVIVHSLNDWTKNHMPIVLEKLNLSKQQKIPLQRELKFY